MQIFHYYFFILFLQNSSFHIFLFLIPKIKYPHCGKLKNILSSIYYSHHHKKDQITLLNHFVNLLLLLILLLQFINMYQMQKHILQSNSPTNLVPMIYHGALDEHTIFCFNLKQIYLHFYELNSIFSHHLLMLSQFHYYFHQLLSIFLVYFLPFIV